MSQPSAPLQDLLSALRRACHDGTLALDANTLGPTAAAPLADLIVRLLQVPPCTLTGVQLPGPVTGTEFAVSGHDGALDVSLTFTDTGGAVAIEAVFAAPQISALTDAFPALPAGFFAAITTSASTASVSVPGLVQPLTFSAPRFGVACTITPESGLVTMAIAPRLDGQVSVQGVAKGLLVNVETATTGYRVAPVTGTWTLTDLAALVPGLGLAAVLAAVIPVTVSLRGFELSLVTSAPDLSSLWLDVADASDPAKPLWSAAGGKVELNDVAVTLDLTYSGPTTLSLPGTGSLTGDFLLGSRTITAEIPCPPTGIWSVTAYPNLSLPTLDDIATLVAGGSSLHDLLPAGLASVGVFELSYLCLAVDIGTFSLAEFTVGLSATAPWTLIPGVVELSDLQLTLTIDGEPAVSGGVIGTLALPGGADIVLSFGRATPQETWRLDVVSPAIPLPSLRQLTQLTQGQDLAPLIKAGGLDTLQFVLTDLNFGAEFPAAGSPRLTNLGLALQLAGPPDPDDPQTLPAPTLDWELIPGVLTLTEFSFGFEITWGATKDDVTKEAFGTFVLNGLEFDIRFASQASGTGLIAEFSAEGNAGTIHLKDLIHSIAPQVADTLIPDGLQLELADAVLAYVNAGHGPKFVFAMDIGAEFPVSDLPLIGQALPPDATAGISDLKVVLASAELLPAEADFINAMSPKPILVPGTSLPAGVTVRADLNIGSDHLPVSLALAAPATKPGPTAALPAPSAQTTGAAQWFTVQRTVGVLTINRIGILYQNGALLFGLDAAITLGPLVLSLQGLAVGSELAEFRPVASLDGIGLSYAEGPLAITGALTRVPAGSLPAGVTLQFDGSALVQAETFGLAAVGSWAQLANGQPSLFVFARYDEPLGGPPALFVTGLMAGFGYNRSLALPAQDEVGSFPLLLLGQPGPGKPASAADVLAILEGTIPAGPGGTSRQWIAPAPGSDWLAAGLEFTSFELVHSQALLIAQFGGELAFALLGRSVIQLPVAAEPGPTYAYAELDLAAVLRPAAGVFTLTAVLSPASYVLTQACHLTGGFAMSAWFGDSPYAGQFVLTLGGYHPAFAPPSYYPAVPRLGFAWAVSGTVSVTGSAYLAITPSCVMAGAALDVQFHDGDLAAWFTATADMLLSWRPFFFTARMQVSIGIAYRLNVLGCGKTLSLSIGAGLQLWGPPTGGQAHVELWVISFTVAFGAGQPGTADQPLSWHDFSALLPGTSAAVTISATGGLLATVDASTTASTSGKTWLVRAKDFSFSTRSALPASHLRYGDTALTAAADPHNFDGQPVDVRPMNLTGAAGVHKLTLLRDGQPQPPASWTMSPHTASLPESLWGAPPAPFTQTPAQPAAAVLPRYVGYDVTAAQPAAGASRGAFQIAEAALQPGGLPLAASPPADPAYTPAADATSVALIAGVAAAAPRRTALYQALAGVFAGTDGPLTQLAAAAQHEFMDEPMTEGAAR